MLIETHVREQATPVRQTDARHFWSSRGQANGAQGVSDRGAASTPSAPNMPRTVVTIAHSSALVAAGLATTLQLMPDLDVHIVGDPADGFQRGPHESRVHILIGDEAQTSKFLAEAPWHASGGPERRTRVVLLRNANDPVDLCAATALDVDAWLSVDCSADELFATVRRLSSRLAPDLPGASVAGPVRGGLAPGALRRVREHVQQRLAERIELSDLAEIAGLSDCHFARAFKQSVGMPPHRYILQRRIEVAALLIERTDRPLSEIALDVGFSDQSHFTRMFSRLTRQTPREFRHQRR